MNIKILDLNELESILKYLEEANNIYFGSIYKYGVYRAILKKKYPTLSEYKIKKKFDMLIRLGYIRQIQHNRSFKYQFVNFYFNNGRRPYNEVEANTEGPIILHFD
jgi:hypothetical protein|tara:strand:+ start:190 stop:507 length:318 start_codon:yes stop_codon:yes gene_type:complete